jgi:hypothetical protein
MNTISVKSNLKLYIVIAKILGNLFTLIYAVLFIPSLFYIPLLGAFSLDADGVTTFGAVLCILVLATIPFSMPFSVYLIYTRFARARYGQMLFFCFLPLLCCVMAPLLALMIICFYDHTLIPYLAL